MCLEEPRKDLQQLFRTVWDDIILPIVNILQHDLKLQHRSRIWLCPTLLLSLSMQLTPFGRRQIALDPEACLENIYI
ncbi:hypothetical protein BDR04DRAFT_879588 [Suillus decipiens]|nr:hypothetical protein BDR04DRAFT_879588 [Suillus decipiens]